MRIAHFMPAYGHAVAKGAMRASERDLQFCGLNGYQWYPIDYEGSDIVSGRNQAVNNAIAAECDYLYMQDADCMAADVSALEVMLETMTQYSANVVGMVVPLRTRSQRYNAVGWQAGEVRAGDGVMVGTGLMLIDVAMVKELPHPRFSQQRNESQTTITLGEDYSFCRLVSEQGYRVAVDARYRTAHGFRHPIVYDPKRM